VRALLESGCPVGAADYDLRTAAHIACAENNATIVKILHDFGADFHSSKVKDRYGNTPLMEAERLKHKELVKIINGFIR
jgi:ankyrin repeat protein